MSSTDRQNRLLLAEDWKRVYQTFRNADFKSYDFDNLRRTMIAYLRENYPEDFNDYTESSEYLALIDLIAYLGQNIAFRIDLNARENYLELAERRESVLRLARLLSYNPKRNRCANGLLKIDSVSTTEEVTDSNNINLENQTILWNDPSNPDWFEQYTRVLNAALPVNGTVGRPVKSGIINDIPTQQYRFNSTNTEVPAYSFTKTVDGRSTSFEIISTDITDAEIVEEAPFPGNNFAFLYRDDGQGSASSNTGFFVHFRQGTLDTGTFNVTNPSTSQVVAVDATNINQSDVWLYKLDSLGNEQELWTKVDSVEGNNIIYNSLSRNQRNIYSVLTRIEDRISLIFSDGVFGNLPQGNFRVYYRTSKNQRVLVTPDDMRGISIRIPYVSKAGKAETITLTLSLKYTVDNATVSESNASIKANAPATYYTQNRLITAEDYQIGPLTTSQEIVKAKAVNRTSSGISRYFDLVDATGKYSTTNLYGKDGSIYKDYLSLKQTFSFDTLTDIEGAIVNTIQPILGSIKVRNYYYDKYPRLFVDDLGSVWNQITSDTNSVTGYLTNPNSVKVKVGTFTGSNMKYVKLNSLLKFEPPAGKHFLNGELVDGEPDYRGGSTYKWTKVVSVSDDGTELLEDGTGPIVFNDVIPTGSRLTEIRTALPTALTADVKAQAVTQIFAYQTFGLRYDQVNGEWRIVTEDNLDISSEFSTGKTGDSTGQQLDSSWLLLFQTDGEKYTITYRAMRYVFESDQEVRFYYDSTDKIYNNKTGKIIKDKISILNINNKPDSLYPFNYDFDWEIVEEYRDAEGYVDSKKIQVSFFDSDDDGVVDNPDLFAEIVDEETNAIDKLVILKKITTTDGVNDFVYVDKDSINLKIFTSKATIGAISQYDAGTTFYYLEEDIFEVLNNNSELTVTSEYKAQIGRAGFKFQYLHAADQNSRIDPSASNIIDTYLLTRGYDSLFRQYLDDSINDKPLPPSSDDLFISYGSEINKIKSLSDEVIYHPVKYKVLFGDKAEADLQARFKIVKNPDLVINDNELKSNVIRAVNRFFALENWDFGDKFYFSELSSYVMNELSPDLVTFVIVPVQEDQSFGSLYEIKSEADEIFISAATVADIDIIDAITANRLKASGNIVTEVTTTNTGIQSGSFSSSNTGGLSY